MSFIEAFSSQAEAYEAEDPRELGWLSRTFSPMKETSLRTGVFTIMSTALGTGCFAIPYVLMSSSFCIGIGMVLFGGGAFLWAFDNLASASFACREKHYADIIRKTLGEKAEKAMQFILVLYIFGSLVSYNVVFCQIIGRLANQFGLLSCDSVKSWVFSTATLGSVNLLMFPLAMKRQLSAFRHMTPIGVFLVVFLFLVIIFETPLYISEYRPEYSWFKFNLVNIMTDFGVTIFAFNCIQNVLGVTYNLRQPVKHRRRKLYLRSIMTMLCSYIIMSSCGYFSLGSKVPGLVFFRPKVGQSDIFMVIGVLGLAFNIALGLPLNLNSSRNQVMASMYGHDHSQENKLVFFVVTCLLYFLPMVVAILFTKIISILSIVGSFCAVFVAFTLPFSACAVTLEKWSMRWALTILAGILLTLLGLVSTCFTIYNIITGSAANTINICVS